MIQSIFRQNGELVTISEVKKKRYSAIFSMRFLSFLTIFLMTAIMILAVTHNMRNSYKRKMMEEELAQIQSQCNILATQVLANQFSISNSTDNLSVEIDQLANVLNGRILIVDSNYRIIKDTYTIEQDKYVIAEDVFGIMKGTYDKKINQSKDYVEVMMPITDSEKKVQGVIIATVSLSSIKEMDMYIKNQSRVLILLFLIIDLVISMFVGNILARDMRKLNAKLVYLEEGQHLDEPIEGGTFREIKMVADTINKIIGKLQVVENSRQEFVSNVSHELKTPITSMKVLADSLLVSDDIPAEMYREFMEDIVAEIDRENEIITDLLTLVKSDKNNSNINIAPVHINDMLEMILKRVRPLAEQRNIEVVYESVREVTAEIDEVKLSLAIMNLIENAVKYNVDNGWIKVTLNADHKYFYVKVADSGVGIPEDCQDHVFERFYRVDKARSRETGGTGLGLAITKNTVLMHKGTIKLYSEPGEGTTFTIRIPLNYIA